MIRHLLVWRLEHRLPWCGDKGHGPFRNDGCTSVTTRPNFGQCQSSPHRDVFADAYELVQCVECNGYGDSYGWCFDCGDRGWTNTLGIPQHMNCGATIAQTAAWWETGDVDVWDDVKLQYVAAGAPELTNGWAFVLYEVPVGDPQVLRVGRQQVVFDRSKSRELGTTQLLSADGVPSLHDACMSALTAI